jgi:hypothetical protein
MYNLQMMAMQPDRYIPTGATAIRKPQSTDGYPMTSTGLYFLGYSAAATSTTERHRGHLVVTSRAPRIVGARGEFSMRGAQSKARPEDNTRGSSQARPIDIEVRTIPVNTVLLIEDLTKNVSTTAKS